MLTGNRSTHVQTDGKDYLYFGGTNYLGLAHRKELHAAAGEAMERYGLSSGASRLTSGETDILLSLEAELARFAGCQAALALPAGFLSNQAVVEAIDDEVDAWLISTAAHASIQSAVRHSEKRVIIDSTIYGGSPERQRQEWEGTAPPGDSPEQSQRRRQEGVQTAQPGGSSEQSQRRRQEGEGTAQPGGSSEQSQRRRQERVQTAQPSGSPEQPQRKRQEAAQTAQPGGSPEQPQCKRQRLADSTQSGGGSHQPLRERLGLPAAARLAVFAEPVEPMTGRLLDMQALISQLNPSDFLILDEAHSFAVLGKNGIGACEYYGLSPAEQLIRTGTFSKAIGTYGGFVLGAQAIIDRVKKNSRIFKGSTSLPPAICAATRQALLLVQHNNAELLSRLRENIDWLDKQLCGLSIAGYANDGVPIFYLPECDAIAGARKMLPERFIYIPGMSSYFAVGRATGLRFTIQSGHSEADLEKLVSVLRECLQSKPVF